MLQREIFIGIFLPLLGTTLGSACVFFMKKEMNRSMQRALTGFAAGVMIAASIWSLLIPSLEQSASFMPAVIGFWVGMLFLLFLDRIIPHLHMDGKPEGPKGKLKDQTMLLLAVTLHNIPEGMAVGVVYVGFLSGSADISAASAFALALGIAIQNFPEGAIVSMPMQASGTSKMKSFMGGFLTGIVEPLATIITILAAAQLIPFMPYLLSFAAGAMMYVVIEELIPEMSEGEHSNIGTIAFAAGFTLMMVLDVTLG